jgi:hypothetical protein
MSLTDTNRFCGGALISPATRTLGFATMNQTWARGKGTAAPNLSAGLTIRGASWGATYNIRVIQVDSSGNPVGDSCQTVVGTVTVDALGNGTGSGAARVLPGATRWWVALNNQADFADFMDTDLVPVI